MARKQTTATATIGFEAKLWLAADKLRNNMDAADWSGATKTAAGSPKGERGGANQYSRAERDRSPKATRKVGAGAPINHIVLGLIFPGAGLKIAWGPAARDFGRGQGGEAGGASRTRHSPQRAVTAEPTLATGKRPVAPRGFGEKAGWLRCSSVGDRCGYPPSSRLAIQPFPRKQDSHGIFRPAPEYISDTAGKCRMANAEIRTRSARPIRHSKFIIPHLPPPADARWSPSRACGTSAKQPTIGKTVDDAMVAIERDNPRLKGVLPKEAFACALPVGRRVVVADFATAQIERRLNP